MMEKRKIEEEIIEVGIDEEKEVIEDEYRIEKEALENEEEDEFIM